jgi:hypothetical protein
MGGVFVTCEREEVRTALWRESMREKDHLEDLEIEERTL